jgi:predicted amidohydrolase
MTSNCSSYKLFSLLFETTKDHTKNLQTLLDLVAKTPNRSIIVAPEVCLSGFDYENYESALNIATIATDELKKVSKEKIIITTMLERSGEEIFNFAKIFFNGEVIYQRAKSKLFRFGNEHDYMSQGSDEDLKIVEVDGIKIGILICFELRFKEFWQKLEGCDVIAVPSWWGVLRSEHFKVLTQSLAIMNQCYVVASDSKNSECTKLSGIITPHGKDERNEDRSSLEIAYEAKEIVSMRKYMDVGIG